MVESFNFGSADGGRIEPRSYEEPGSVALPDVEAAVQRAVDEVDDDMVGVGTEELATPIPSPSLLLKKAEGLLIRAEAVHVEGQPLTEEARGLSEIAKELKMLSKDNGGIGADPRVLVRLEGELENLETEL